jgi:hypothetical protein
VRKADNIPLSCAVVMKCGNLNLEPSGPLRACNRTALPLCMSDEENMQVGCSVGVTCRAKQLNICGDI